MRIVWYDGSPNGYDAAPGWPHDDTADALRFTAAGGWTWLILDDADRVAGECGTKGPPDAAGRVEIGYGLAPGSRGRSLGTRAVAAMLDEIAVFGQVREVVASVHTANVASRRLLERLGFGILSADDTEVTYSRLL